MNSYSRDTVHSSRFYFIFPYSSTFSNNCSHTSRFLSSLPCSPYIFPVSFISHLLFAPLSRFRIYPPLLFLRPHPSHSLSRLSISLPSFRCPSSFLHSLLCLSRRLSFCLSYSPPLSLYHLLISLRERLVCGGFLYRNGVSAAVARPNGRQGATRAATRKDFRERKGPCRDVCVWPSTCNQETRTHAQSWARYREGNEWIVPTEMLSRIIFLIHWYQDLRQLDTPARNKNLNIWYISIILNRKLKYFLCLMTQIKIFILFIFPTFYRHI